MKLYLKRYRIRIDSTDGELTNDEGTHICDTAESTQTMLAEGTYRLITGGRHVFSHGNGVYGKGCGAKILVGEHLVPGVVIRSLSSYKRLIKRIKMARKRGSIVELTITS